MKRITALLAALLLSVMSACAESAVIYFRQGEALVPVAVETQSPGIRELFTLAGKSPSGKNTSSVIGDNISYISSISMKSVAEIRLESTTEPDRLLAEGLGRTICENTPAESLTVIINGRFFARYPSGSAVIYYPEETLSYVVPVLLKSGLTPAELIAQMERGSEGLMPAIPAESGSVSLSYSFVSDGRRVHDIDFPISVFKALESSSETRWQFLASLSLTMLDNLTDIDCIRVSFDGQTVQGVPDKDGTLLRIENGCIDRSCFESYIGCRAGESCISANDSANPRAVLPAVLPQLIEQSDVVNWSQSDGVTTVSLSRRFYSACADMTAEEEHKTVYAIVNALCSATGAKAARINIEGTTVETLAGSISLNGELLPY